MVWIHFFDNQGYPNSDNNLEPVLKLHENLRDVPALLTRSQYRMENAAQIREEYATLRHLTCSCMLLLFNIAR